MARSLLFSVPPIPSELQNSFWEELITTRYHYCVAIALLTTFYPFFIFLFLRSKIWSYSGKVGILILIPLLIIFITSLVTVLSVKKINKSSNSLKAKSIIIKYYSWAFLLSFNVGYILTWIFFGINYSYIIGIFVYAIIFYEDNKISLLLYVLNFILYAFITKYVEFPFPNTMIAYTSGTIATWGGLLISRLFYRSKVQEFLYRHQLQLQSEELAKLNTELNRLVGIDGLTHVANRRKFDEFLQQTFEELTIRQKYLGILLLDVDYFKLYNDTYGHQAGDECLRNIAFAVQEEIRREGDLLARYGGEEFVIILSHTSPEEAENIAQRICSKIETLNIPHVRSPLEKVTVSIGIVCQVPEGEEKPENLVLKADKALYEAKKRGRNQFVNTNH